MKIPGNATPKARANPYAGRTSHGGADGLGKFDENQTAPQSLGDPEVTQRAKNYSNMTAKSWVHGGDAMSRPGFDHSTARRGNDAPISKGGEDGKRNHFSAAASGIKGRED